jgi:hypothetical protein
MFMRPEFPVTRRAKRFGRGDRHSFDNIAFGYDTGRQQGDNERDAVMYIGVGTLVAILIIVLIVYFLRRA